MKRHLIETHLLNVGKTHTLLAQIKTYLSSHKNRPIYLNTLIPGHFLTEENLFKLPDGARRIT